MSLDIFEMIINTNEPTIVLVNNELLIFKHYQVDVQDIKCPLQGWEKHDDCLDTFGIDVNECDELLSTSFFQVYMG
jgi:hypothetical protein